MVVNKMMNERMTLMKRKEQGMRIVSREQPDSDSDTCLEQDGHDHSRTRTVTIANNGLFNKFPVLS